MGTNFVSFFNKTNNISKLRTKYFVRNLHYIQGQEPTPKVREYFYYIDHEGMLFLDDAKMKNFTSCFKETKFLKFFFTRIKINKTDRYNQEFPFISYCGRERNYIRCDDLPIVFTQVIKCPDGNDMLAYAHAGKELITQFHPDKIFMKPDSGRVYHPAWPEVGGIGLVRSKLAIEICKYFEFDKGEDNPPTHFTWNGQRLHLDNEWINDTIIKERVAQ
ncbi:UPF0598 protein CG30010 [Eupeodes corollae]|uniref:UPF0598 protein CG30010 n=1 Tax=Eupeodes corollae TaxID=290404 RepID=UPI002491D304|nr:UPF0598 protein CG30010 [Eupeodes corollae]